MLSNSKDGILVAVKEFKEDNTIRLVDLFVFPTGKSYRLTYFGYKCLSKLYYFYELNIQAGYAIRQYSEIERYNKGLYYCTREHSIIRLRTTDKRLVTIFKLFNGDYDLTIEYIKKSIKTA